MDTPPKTVLLVVTVDPDGHLIVSPRGAPARVLPRTNTWQELADLCLNPAVEKHEGDVGFSIGQTVRDIVGALTAPDSKEQPK